MKRSPVVVDSGRVVALSPALLSVKGAALYLSCSASLLNQLRATDARRLLRAESAEGPPWILLGYGIRYRVADLDAWISRTAVVGGVCDSHRRTQPASEVAP